MVRRFLVLALFATLMQCQAVYADCAGRRCARPVATIARGTAHVAAAATRGAVRVARAPVKLAAHVAERGVERRHARRAHRGCHGRRVVLFPRIRFFPG